MIIADNNAFL